MASTEWEVHVTGPDDVLPAASRLDAMRQAAYLNAASLAVIEAEGDNPAMPMVWAIPRPGGAS